MAHKVGTEVYYRGDRANADGWGVVAEVDGGKYRNGQSRIAMDDGRDFWIPSCMISDVDSGDGMTRFVTREAYDERRAKLLARYC